MSFGSRLRGLRIERNMTQEDLANILKIARATVGRYETDERFPDKETLNTLADYFNVTVDYLLGRSEIRNNAELTILKQTEDAYRVDPDMLIQMCRATDLPEEERKKIKEYSAFIIEKFLREKAEKEK